jgi:AraC-like DNA-binding protein
VNYLLGDKMITVEVAKTFSWPAAENISQNEARKFYDHLGAELSECNSVVYEEPVAALRAGLYPGIEVLVNTAMQTLYDNTTKSKQKIEDLTKRLIEANYKMSDLAIMQQMLVKMEVGLDAELVYQASGLVRHEAARMIRIFYDNSLAVVQRDISMTRGKEMVEKGCYSLKEIAEACGYANLASFRICYDNFHGEKLPTQKELDEMARA